VRGLPVFGALNYTEACTGAKLPEVTYLKRLPRRSCTKVLAIPAWLASSMA
jgi:hypothetical protein